MTRVPKLIDVTCRNCGSWLAAATQGAEVYCPHCGSWTRSETPEK